MLASSIFLIALGGISLHLIPNLYKILTFDCTATSSVKKKIISETMKDLNAFFIDNPKNYWTFRYQRGCWTFDFNVYLTFNDTNLLASVVGCTSSGGFIDFGQTERLRKKLNKIVMEKIKQV